MANARPQWIVGLETWVMEDGNYGNFSAGETTEFALEFWDRTLAPTELRQRRLSHGW